jgi:hypothetical protein
MPGKAYVTVSPDVLNIHNVWSALVWIEQFANETLPAGGYDQLRAQLSQENQLLIVADGYDPDHHFGPVLTLKGTRPKVPEFKSKFATEEESLEIVVPWNKVLSVVRDNNGKFKPGFYGETNDVPPPEKDQQ